MKHSDHSGSVRFRSRVEEIEAKRAVYEENQPYLQKELKPISGRRATGYTPAKDEFEEERRQIRQLMNDRKANYNQNYSNRDERNGGERESKKKGVEVKSSEDLSNTSSGNHNDASEVIKTQFDQSVKSGFGAKLASAMRFVKKHDHAGHDMTHSDFKQKSLNPRNNADSDSNDELEPVENGRYMTAPGLTEAFAPIFADGHGMFIPSTKDTNSLHLHKSMANLPKGNSSFAAIVQSAVQNQVVGGEIRIAKKSKKSSNKVDEVDMNLSDEDLEKILSEAVCERIRFLAASAKSRVRESALKIADSTEESGGSLIRSKSKKSSFDQRKQMSSISQENLDEQSGKKHTSKFRRKTDENGDFFGHREGREWKKENDTQVSFAADKRVEANDASNASGANGSGNLNRHMKSEVIWIGRDGRVIDDPTARKPKFVQRQPTKMTIFGDMETAVIHDQPLPIDQDTHEASQKDKAEYPQRPNDHHGRPSLDSIRSEPQHRSSRTRNRSHRQPRLSEDNVGIEDQNYRASEETHRSHGSSRRHRSRHERPHRSRNPEREEGDLTRTYHVTTEVEDIDRNRHQTSQEKEKDYVGANHTTKCSDPFKYAEAKRPNADRVLEQTDSSEMDQIEADEKRAMENGPVNNHSKFKSFRALGHAIAIGNSMHNGKKSDHKSPDDCDSKMGHSRERDGPEKTADDVHKKIDKFVDAHGETRLNEALDIAKMMMEHELLEVKAEKRRHQMTIAALDPNANQKGVKGALKAVKNAAHHRSHHNLPSSDGEHHSGGKSNRTKGPHSATEVSANSPGHEQQTYSRAEDAYEQALRNEIKSKKERIKTSHFINEQKFGINGLL